MRTVLGPIISPGLQFPEDLEWPERMALEIYLEELQNAILVEAISAIKPLQKSPPSGQGAAAHRYLALVLHQTQIETLEKYFAHEAERKRTASEELAKCALNWIGSDSESMKTVFTKAIEELNYRYDAAGRVEPSLSEQDLRLWLGDRARRQFLAESFARLAE